MVFGQHLRFRVLGLSSGLSLPAIASQHQQSQDAVHCLDGQGSWATNEVQGMGSWAKNEV